jgi:serine protease Do
MGKFHNSLTFFLYDIIITDEKREKMKKINVKALFLAIILILSLTLISATGCITIATKETATPTTTVPAPTVTLAPITAPVNPTWTPPVASSTNNELPSIADVVALVKPSVVAINTEVVAYDFFNRPVTQEGAGSGWIIDPNGIVVTNNHVVEGAKTITVTTDDGQTFTADVNSVATDPLNDLAIIKIDANNLPAISIGDSAKMRVGDWVIAIGNALGQGIRATEGIISRQDVSLQVDKGETLYDLIETSAAINPGNSGGPLLNLAGQVIGITSAKVAQVGVEGMGYAISSDTALPIIQELVNKGYVTRPYLGIGLYTVDQMAIQQLDLKVDKGVLVTEVVANNPADQAGIKKWDVIVNIGGQDVSNVEDLTKVLHAATIGQPLDVKYYRGNREYTTQVIPIESPRPQT